MIKQISQILPTLFLTTILFLSCQDQTSPVKAVTTENLAAKIEKSQTKERLLRHVVLFKFKESSSAEDIDRLNKAFHALPAAIPVIKDFEWGLNDSPENFHQDFTHCYLLTFDSEEDRDSIYAPHPQHQAFGASLQEHLDGVFVVDYWTNP